MAHLGRQQGSSIENYLPAGAWLDLGHQQDSAKNYLPLGSGLDLGRQQGSSIENYLPAGAWRIWGVNKAHQLKIISQLVLGAFGASTRLINWKLSPSWCLAHLGRQQGSSIENYLPAGAWRIWGVNKAHQLKIISQLVLGSFGASTRLINWKLSPSWCWAHLGRQQGSSIENYLPAGAGRIWEEWNSSYQSWSTFILFLQWFCSMPSISSTPTPQ